MSAVMYERRYLKRRVSVLTPCSILTLQSGRNHMRHCQAHLVTVGLPRWRGDAAPSKALQCCCRGVSSAGSATHHFHARFISDRTCARRILWQFVVVVSWKNGYDSTNRPGHVIGWWCARYAQRAQKLAAGQRSFVAFATDSSMFTCYFGTSVIYPTILTTIKRICTWVQVHIVHFATLQSLLAGLGQLHKRTAMRHNFSAGK